MAGGAEWSKQDVHLTRGASYLIIQNLGLNVISIVSFAILAHLISPREMGIWTILNLIIAVAQTFATWYPQGVTKFVAENVAKGYRDKAAAAFYQALRTTLVMYLPVVIIIYLGAAFLASRFLGDMYYIPMIQVLALDVLFNAGLLPTLTAALLGLHMYRETATWGLATLGVLRQTLIISLILLTGNFIGLVIGWLVSDAVTTAIYFALTVRGLGRPTFNFSLVKLTRFSLPLELISIIQFVSSWYDRVMLTTSVSLASLGIYNASLTAFGVLGSVTSGVNNMLLPAYSSIRKDIGRNMNEAAQLAVHYSSLILTPLAFGMFATSRAAITLFVGEPYSRGSLPLLIVTGSFAIVAFGVALGPVLVALGDTTVVAAISVVTTVISIPIAYLLLPHFGIIGAAISRAVGTLLSVLLTVVIVIRRIALKLDFRKIGKTLLSGGTMAVVLFAVQLVIYSKFMLPLYVLIGAIVYLLMLRVLKLVSTDDLELLQGLLGERLFVVNRILSWIVVKSD